MRSRRTRCGDHAEVARWYGMSSMNRWIPYGVFSDRSLRRSAGVKLGIAYGDLVSFAVA